MSVSSIGIDFFYNRFDNNLSLGLMLNNFETPSLLFYALIGLNSLFLLNNTIYFPDILL